MSFYSNFNLFSCSRHWCWDPENFLRKFYFVFAVFSQCCSTRGVKPSERILWLWKVKVNRKACHLASGESDKKWQGQVMSCNKRWCHSTICFFILISSLTQFLLLSYQMVLVMLHWAGTCDMQAATGKCSLEIAVPNF